MNQENEKKVYEEPTVEKVEFDFSEVIAASGCAEWCIDTNTSVSVDHVFY